MLVYIQDLDSDNVVSKEELSIFLKHLFTEQLRQAEELMTKEAKSRGGVGRSSSSKVELVANK